MPGKKTVASFLDKSKLKAQNEEEVCNEK